MDFVAELPAKDQRNLQTHILEDTLTKRPYAKSLTAILLEESVKAVLNPQKLAQEVHKNVTSEDLVGLAYQDLAAMEEHEKKYRVVKGTSLQDDLARIVHRYVSEGKPEFFNQPEGGKKVRFEEGNNQMYSNADN